MNVIPRRGDCDVAPSAAIADRLHHLFDVCSLLDRQNSPWKFQLRQFFRAPSAIGADDRFAEGVLPAVHSSAAVAVKAGAVGAEGDVEGQGDDFDRWHGASLHKGRGRSPAQVHFLTGRGSSPARSRTVSVRRAQFSGVVEARQRGAGPCRSVASNSPGSWKLASAEPDRVGPSRPILRGRGGSPARSRTVSVRGSGYSPIQSSVGNCERRTPRSTAARGGTPRLCAGELPQSLCFERRSRRRDPGAERVLRPAAAGGNELDRLRRGSLPQRLHAGCGFRACGPASASSSPDRLRCVRRVRF
jgi:hypothetical protein